MYILQYSIMHHSHWHHFGPKSGYTIPLHPSPISSPYPGCLTDEQLWFAVYFQEFPGDIETTIQ